MTLDDRLAALAAGELDDDTARALRARAAADPALARRLARHERLQELLAGWDAPAMPDDAVQRLEARIDEALAELGDGPLADRTPASVPEASPHPSSSPRSVVDLGRERDRRAATGGGSGIDWSGWRARAAVAAVLAVVVGTGVVLGGLPGGAGLDMLAGGDSGEDAAQVAEDEADDQDEGATDDTADSGPAEAQAEADMEEEAADQDSAAADETEQLGPARRDDVDIAEGDLLVLLDLGGTSTTQEATGADGSASDPATTRSAEQCATDALRRDTSQGEEREVWLVAEGTYDDRDAVFVVVRTPGASQDRYEVLAYDPEDCSLLARDEAMR